jgi:SAM-dependent methyltransferase
MLIPDFDFNAAVRDMHTNPESLRVRMDIHANFTAPPTDLVPWALGLVAWRGGEQVLDVGCGPGRWYRPLLHRVPQVEYRGIDRFEVMLDGHPAPERVLPGDIARIPFPDHSFDVVMANHMLFFVDDIDGAIAECKRVLRPGGLFMATTNSNQNMPELQVLLKRAVTLLVPPNSPYLNIPAAPSDRFSLEVGTRLLARHFGAVVRYDLPGALIFNQADPLLNYLESSRSLREPLLGARVAWADVMLMMREQVTRLIDHFGELVVNKLTGVLIATDTGGFIHDYLEHQARSHGASAGADTTKTAEAPAVDDTPTVKLERPTKTKREKRRSKKKRKGR